MTNNRKPQWRFIDRKRIRDFAQHELDIPNPKNGTDWFVQKVRKKPEWRIYILQRNKRIVWFGTMRAPDDKKPLVRGTQAECVVDLKPYKICELVPHCTELQPSEIDEDGIRKNSSLSFSRLSQDTANLRFLLNMSPPPPRAVQEVLKQWQQS